MAADETYVYVDGFNLYYGALKNTPYKWLNLQTLCERMLPPDRHKVTRIKYFTARVRARFPGDQSPVHQDLYIRALRTLPSVEVIEGHFLIHHVRMPLANQASPASPPEMALVERTDEKRSDVALASNLIHDGWLGNYQSAVLITNDSDQVPAIEIVRRANLGKVGLLIPTLDRTPSTELRQVATFWKPIRPGHLEKSQFPYQMRDSMGQLNCPVDWRM